MCGRFHPRNLFAIIGLIVLAIGAFDLADALREALATDGAAHRERRATVETAASSTLEALMGAASAIVIPHARPVEPATTNAAQQTSPPAEPAPAHTERPLAVMPTNESASSDATPPTTIAAAHATHNR